MYCSPPRSEGLERSTLCSSPSWLGFYPRCPWAICSNSAGSVTSSHGRRQLHLPPWMLESNPPCPNLAGKYFINIWDGVIGEHYRDYVGVTLFNFGSEHDEGNGMGIAIMSVSDVLQMRKSLRKEACQGSCRGMLRWIYTRKCSPFSSLCCLHSSPFQKLWRG